MALAVLLVGGGCAFAPVSPVDPLTAEEHDRLGLAYFARGEFAPAASAFERALVRRPGWAQALRHLADARLAQGEQDAAIAAYEAARAVDPRDPATANNLAWALLQHPSRWPEAETLVRRALEAGAEPRAYYLDTLGLALLRKGEPAAALAAFRAALADPALGDPRERAEVARRTAGALSALGDRAAAERCLEFAASLSRGDGPRMRGPGAPRDVGDGNSVGAQDTPC